MRADSSWKKSFSKLFVTSLIVGLGACSSQKSHHDEAAIDSVAASDEMDAAAAGSENSAESSNQATTESASGPRRYTASQQIKVQTSPFEKEGFVLNGVYFVRSAGESWSQLSQTLYGRPDRDQLLKQWNGNQDLVVGAAVYYNSPSRPNDRDSMKPFAMDFGSSLEKHVVKKGESLSLIAQNAYGDPMSWKELSALNPDIQNPDRIEIGQSIVMQPQNVDSQKFLASLINQETPALTPAETSTAQAEPIQDQKLNPPTAEAVAPDENIAPPPAPEAKPEIISKRPEKKTNGFLAWLQFMQGDSGSSNLFLIGMVLILGALLFLVINNRRKAAKRHLEEVTNLSDLHQKTGSQD